MNRWWSAPNLIGVACWHRCCQPVAAGLMSIICARISFVEDIVAAMEQSHPDIVVSMLSSPVMTSRIDSDGCARSLRNDALQWDPRDELRQQLTRVYGFNSYSARTAASCAICRTDSYMLVSQPYCDEAPRLVLDLVAAEPTSVIAADWRRYARTVLVPLVHEVAQCLIEHSATIEWPPISWLVETFPTERAFQSSGWSNDIFGQMWVGYCASWAR
eukprot:SAG31_NODE_2337_length_5921_cov_4.269323_6_plen_216_part_00